MMKFPWLTRKLRYTKPTLDPLLRDLPEAERWLLIRHPQDMPDYFLQLQESRRLR